MTFVRIVDVQSEESESKENIVAEAKDEETMTA